MEKQKNRKSIPNFAKLNGVYLEYMVGHTLKIILNSYMPHFVNEIEGRENKNSKNSKFTLLRKIASGRINYELITLLIYFSMLLVQSIRFLVTQVLNNLFFTFTFKFFLLLHLKQFFSK